MPGADFFDSQTVLVNVANLTLGIATLLFIAALGWSLVQEVRARRRLVPVDDSMPDPDRDGAKVVLWRQRLQDVASSRRRRSPRERDGDKLSFPPRPGSPPR